MAAYHFPVCCLVHPWLCESALCNAFEIPVSFAFFFLDAFIEYKDTKAIPHQGSIHVSEKMNRNVTDAVSKKYIF